MDPEFQDMLERIRPECGGCPQDLIVQALRDVVRDFCQQTRAWQYEVEHETILQAVSDYDIELPNTDAYPIAIEYMTVSGVESKFRSKDWLDRHVFNWRFRESDDFTVFTHVTPKIISFAGVPTKTGPIGEVYYRVSLKPTESALTIPQELADEWIEVWSDGAKAALKSMSNKPWTDPKRAGDLESKYRSARANARIRAARSYGNSQDRWVGPKFA